MNEWEFTAYIASRINIILEGNTDWPYSAAKCEQTGETSRKRRDLTLLDKNGRVLLTGEIKLPYRKDGGSPYNARLVEDARRKAVQAGCQYYFTWNVNEFVLWETGPRNLPWTKRNYGYWEVTKVTEEKHLRLPGIEHAIEQWLYGFLESFAGTLRGDYHLGKRSPDEKFIDALESALKLPISYTLEKLEELYSNAAFRKELDGWMRDEQGWLIHHDPEGVRENLERAAKFSCYALVNKLVFYEAMLKKYKSRLKSIEVPEHVDRGDDIRDLLEGKFEEAKKATGDYETIFGENLLAIGARIPFLSDRAAPYWGGLMNNIHDFDFSKLDYDVIGAIFEKLISPEERHKYGQFYTRVEVVDLINSFCIRDGHEALMDPACGGGTFLVRAYARKKTLAPSSNHNQLLSELYGVDVSNFAAHLTTINLAARDLVEMQNYPRVARSDFFHLAPHKAFLSVPEPKKDKGSAKSAHREISIPHLDAVVGNPPYIRQEEIAKKESLVKLTKDESNLKLSGRSDIHCYFWPHAARFLKDDGCLCFLTSSQWLDVEYGFNLQNWILCNFEIVAIFESQGEPWFIGARVATTITVLKRQSNELKRMNNIVRFIQLRQPIGQLMSHDGSMAGAVSAANRFRDEILSLKENVSNNRFRARLIPQGELWRQGVELGRTMGKSNGHANGDDEGQNGDYYGGKWGVYLRAPDLWFKLMDEWGEKFVPLGCISDIRFGIKSGKDCFFYPKDQSHYCLARHADPKEFKALYGATRKEVESGKVKLVSCGEGMGEIRPIESKYLELEAHSLMEIAGYEIRPELCERSILLIDKKKAFIKDKYIRDYIKWGEKKKYHQTSTCSSRASDNREWFNLTGHSRGQIFWPMAQQYKHIAPVNRHNLICNHNLFDVFPTKCDEELLVGILNSTWTVLSKYQFGRPVGVEGNLKTEVIDVKMMLVPFVTKMPARVRERIVNSFTEMRKRNALQFLSEQRLRKMAYEKSGKEEELKKLLGLTELDMPDRRELDDAVLEMIGVSSQRRRKQLIDELYEYLKQFFEWTRRKEEEAIANKKKAKRRGPARPADIAQLIYKDIIENHRQLLRYYNLAFLDQGKPHDTYFLPEDGEPEPHSDMFVEHGLVFKKRGKTLGEPIKTRFAAQATLALFLAEHGHRRFVFIPYKEDECLRVFNKYKKFVKERDERIKRLIAERTSDEEMQEKIFELIVPLVLRLRHF